MEKITVKSLSELGLGDSKAVKMLLKTKSGAFKSLVLTKGASKLTYEEYNELVKAKKALRRLSKEERATKIREINNKLSPTLNFDEARFFIPEDMKDASERFIADKSTTLVRGLISCALILVFYLIIALLMPTLLSFISNIISQ